MSNCKDIIAKKEKWKCFIFVELFPVEGKLSITMINIIYPTQRRKR